MTKSYLAIQKKISKNRNRRDQQSLELGFKINIKKTKVRFNNQLVGQEIIISNKTLERMKEDIPGSKIMQILPMTDKARGQ